MIQVEVQKNTILKEDIEFGVGTVTQTRGNAPFTGTKVNVAEMPYSLTQTFGEKVTEIQTQYDYIIANVASDPSAVPMTNLIRKNGNDLVDNVGAVFTPQVIDSASNLEGSYVKKLWVKIISGTEHQLKRGTAIIARFNPTTGAQIFNFDYAAIAAALNLGTSAFLDHGTTANKIVKLDGNAKLPAVDGSNLTNLPIPPAPPTVPIGGIIIWPGSGIPSGYMLCNGSAISRTTYDALHAVIGTTYGPGDGSTTFQLPDLRGEFVRGLDSGRGVDTGRTLGSAQEDQFEEHRHLAQVAQNGGTTAAGADRTQSQNSNYNSGNADYTSFYSGTEPNISRTSLVGGSGETRPRNIAMNYIIRVS